MYATPEDVGDLTVTGEATRENLAALLDAAWVVLKAEIPSLETRISAGRIDPAVVKLVLVEMVQARVQNPSGVRTDSQTTGPFGRTLTYDSTTITSGLDVTDRHRKLLLGAPMSAYTVRAPDTPAWRPDPSW